MSCISQIRRAANGQVALSGETERNASETVSAERGATALDRMSEHVRLLDPAVSFVLNVLFDSNRTKVEVRIARAMFRPGASIVLIPRERPTLACAVGVDEFFATEKEMLKCADGWEEAMRLHDPSGDSPTRMRVRSHILMDARIAGAKPRRVDVIFALRNISTAQRIHSCTIVYDESPRLASPVTLFG
ncbi:MAG: hypothetical protein ACREPX_10315 [Rhodanobacteraceae bacterium]